MCWGGGNRTASFNADLRGDTGRHLQLPHSDSQSRRDLGGTSEDSALHEVFRAGLGALGLLRSQAECGAGGTGGQFDG